MATITLRSGSQPESVHVGLNVLHARVSLSVSLSVGDIHIVGALPQGAIPLDAVFYPGAGFTNASTGAIMKIGTSASNDMFFASATYSQTTQSAIRTTRVLGTLRQISLSDDFMPRYDNVVFVGTAGFSIGHVGDLIVYYKMPGQTL